MEIVHSIARVLLHLVGFIGFVAAWAAAALACENHDKLDKLEKKVDHLADQVYEVEGVGDVPAESEERH